MFYVSYSKKDRPFVQRVCQSLTEKGIPLFVDYEQLAGGDYAQELTKQIESADAVLFFYSENTENSTWVKHEIEFSVSKNKIIIPVSLSEPKKDSWFHFYLGTVNWIKVDGDDVNSIEERLLYYRNGSIPSKVNRIIEDNGCLTKAQQSDKTKLTRQKKKIGCRIILILSSIAFCLFFALFYIGRSNVVSSPPSEYTIDYEREDSLVLKQKEAELRKRVDILLLSLQQEIVNPHVAGSDEASRSIIHDIEIALGWDSIPFPQDNTNTQQGRLKAFHKYQETVYSVLDRKIAQMESELGEEMSSNNESPNDDQNGNKQNGHNVEGNECYSLDNASFMFLLLVSFVVGSVLTFLLLRIKNSRKDNIKLSSDIASKISIDGCLQKEIESREVYTTHLKKGEYLIDFEDRKDENRHKTFNYEVTTKESKLVFAKFVEESSQNGKTIKCFIAGSKMLPKERDALRAITCVMYNKWDSKNFRILSYTFEDFSKEHTLVPPQELYNKFIEEEADWALFIIDGEIGGITLSEYRVAMDSFKKNGSPKILALAKVGSENNEKVAEIRDEINKEHQYWTDYTDIVSLKYIFESTLNWDLIRLFGDS